MTKGRVFVLAFIGVLLLFLLSGCNPQARGFALPKGDTERGKAAVVELGCTHCHSVRGQIERDAQPHPEIHFILGGATSRVRTYGDLVTSIINPNHKISGFARREQNTDESGNTRMPSLNEEMTVQELVDITTYLETTYELVRPQNHTIYYP